MIKGFFFDLDGTLVDTHQANFQAYKSALNEFGVNITFADFKKTIGHQAKTFLPLLAPGLTDEEIGVVATRKAEYYKELMHLSELNESLVKFIDLMKGHKMALVTTAKKRNADAVLSHHGLNDKFDCVITAEDVESSKPDPAGYLLALEATSLSPGEVIAFEDSEVGIKAAEAAGITVVRVRNFAP